MLSRCQTLRDIQILGLSVRYTLRVGLDEQVPVEHVPVRKLLRRPALVVFDNLTDVTSTGPISLQGERPTSWTLTT